MRWPSCAAARACACCRERRPSATSRRTSSAWPSVSPITSHYPPPTCRASGCGRCAPRKSCWRQAPSSARWYSRTMICRASCWRAPGAHIWSATVRSPAVAQSSLARTTASTPRRWRCIGRASPSPPSSTRGPKHPVMLQQKPARQDCTSAPAPSRSARAVVSGSARCSSARETAIHCATPAVFPAIAS